LKASDLGSYASYYDLPGGRIDTDELNTDFAAIIAREMAEETGAVKYRLHDRPVALGRHVVTASQTRSNQEIHILYLFFEAEYLGGDITISTEHQDYKWVNLQKIDLSEYFISGILEGISSYLQG
jgi:8-oxo-dGTP diphosphatase